MDEVEIIGRWEGLEGSFANPEESWREPEPTIRAALRRFDADEIWFQPSSLVSGDYAGGVLAKSNFERMIQILEEDMAPEHGDKWWDTKRYAYGGRAIVFHVEDTPTDVIDILAALQEYPVLCEDHYSLAMADAEQEAWNSWVRDDYLRALVERFGDDDDEAEELSDEDLWEHFREAAEEANAYWEDSDEGIYVDVARVAKSADSAPWA